jgi:ComF family protein
MGKTQILSQLKNLIFPPECWHCNVPRAHLLCESCRGLLDILPVDPSKPIVTFEGQGPAWTLIKILKSGKAPKLAEGLAGYMALQYLKIELPLPDLIVPVPQSLFRSLQVGYNPSLLLAIQLGKILNRPVFQLLRRRRQWVRQMNLDKERRYRLSVENFAWKKKISIEKKTILLLDDIVGTGATLRACAQKLYEGFPLKVMKMGCVGQQL